VKAHATVKVGDDNGQRKKRRVRKTICRRGRTIYFERVGPKEAHSLRGKTTPRSGGQALKTAKVDIPLLTARLGKDRASEGKRGPYRREGPSKKSIQTRRLYLFFTKKAARLLPRPSHHGEAQVEDRLRKPPFKERMSVVF